MAEPAIFFGPPPNINDLCCITVELYSTNKFIATSSVLQLHIVKCREIIFTEPDVIASPVFGLENTFNVILQQTLFKTGKLQARLQKQGMKFSKPYRVVLAVYQECLRYTLTARLAPAWNKVADWYIQGRDFLSHEGYSNAVKTELFVTKDEVFVSLYATAIRFPPLTIRDLDLTQEEHQALVKSTEEDIQEITIADRWCHVLPSMKRGRISSLSITLPANGPFSTYQDLKRYWKNVYGYRLPDTDDEILYCQIGLSTVQIIARSDPKPILTSFLQDIHSKISTVCGVTFRFQPKIYYPSPALQNATEFTDHANLSKKPQVVVAVRPINKLYFSKSGFQKDLVKNNEAQCNKEAEEKKVLDKMVKPSPYFNIHPTPIDTHDKEQDTNKQPNLKEKHFNSQPSLKRNTLFNSQPSPIKNTHFNSQPYSTDRLFNTQAGPNNSDLSTSEKCSPSLKAPVARLLPIFRPKVKRNTPVTHSLPTELKQQTGCKDKKNTMNKNVSLSLKSPAVPSKLLAKKITSKMPSCNGVQHELVNSEGNGKNSLFPRHEHIDPDVNSKKIFASKHEQVTSEEETNKILLISKASPRYVSSIKSSIDESNKQKISEGETPSKKPRKKSEIQSVNVESLARVNQLSKVNTVTLTAWLKERGITCKSKDKKSDLVKKANTYLNIATSEE
ncbi:hypothetical protein Bpfe_008708 [Biomphalaria pfeifferi]|uniref:DUF4708 domain-containing protein n=1 Tax=Biomphalaria pfeifferi TaxID=112525 RepID=A0AAD8BX62_BIOPF|nr:hypothetical protein Bpfe_008708 [Biomphalaria pfeifferi]